LGVRAPRRLVAPTGRRRPAVAARAAPALLSSLERRRGRPAGAGGGLPVPRRLRSPGLREHLEALGVARRLGLERHPRRRGACALLHPTEGWGAVRVCPRHAVALSRLLEPLLQTNRTERVSMQSECRPSRCGGTPAAPARCDCHQAIMAITAGNGRVALAPWASRSVDGTERVPWRTRVRFQRVRCTGETPALSFESTVALTDRSSVPGMYQPGIGGPRAGQRARAGLRRGRGEIQVTFTRR